MSRTCRIHEGPQGLDIHSPQLRNWVKAFADDSQHAFPGHGQMTPEQLEITQLKREVRILGSYDNHPASQGLSQDHFKYASWVEAAHDNSRLDLDVWLSESMHERQVSLF